MRVKYQTIIYKLPNLKEFMMNLLIKHIVFILLISTIFSPNVYAQENITPSEPSTSTYLEVNSVTSSYAPNNSVNNETNNDKHAATSVNSNDTSIPNKLMSSDNIITTTNTADNQAHKKTFNSPTNYSTQILADDIKCKN